jgi:hypothetical protein
MTYDVDLVVDTTPANLAACEAALVALGLVARLPLRLSALGDVEERRRLESERNLVALTYSDPANPLREVDVLVAPSLEPSLIVEGSIEIALGSLSVRVASIDDLIALKRRAGRAQDLADLVHLERRRKLLDG